MKTWMVLLLIGCWTGSWAQDAGFRLEGEGSVAIPVTVNKMTNLVFPASVRLGVKVTPDVLAQKVRGVDNVIELKAMRHGFPPTNFSVYGSDGRLYSFLLCYVEDTTVLNYRVLVAAGSGAPVVLSGLPVNESRLAADAAMLTRERSFLHVAAHSGGIRLRLDGIWVCDSLQWFCLEIRNRSAVTFHPAQLRWYLVDAQRVTRRAVQEIDLRPVYGAVPVVGGRTTQRFTVGFEPFGIPVGKWLELEVVGQDGRQVKLRVKARIVTKMARLPKGDEPPKSG